MERHEWVYTLPARADKLHSQAFSVGANPDSGVQKASARPESVKTRQAKSPKQASIDSGLLRSRPILRDVMNDLE